MRVALSIGLVISLGVVAISGCMRPQPPIERPPVTVEAAPPVPSAVEVPVVVNNELQEIYTYHQLLTRLQMADLVAEQLQARERYVQQMTPLNRIKYTLALIAGGDPQRYNEIKPLLDPIEDAAPEPVRQFWQVYTAGLGRMLESYLAAEKREHNVKVERDKLKKRGDELRAELKAVQAEKATLTNQLKQLKSIETSIIERDMGDGKTKP